MQTIPIKITVALLAKPHMLIFNIYRVMQEPTRAKNNLEKEESQRTQSQSLLPTLIKTDDTGITLKEIELKVQK